MRSATGSWRRRGSNGRFVASQPPDFQPTAIGRYSAGRVHQSARRHAVRRLNFRFGDDLGVDVLRGHSCSSCWRPTTVRSLFASNSLRSHF